jgi:hypothetical protein
LTNTTIADDRWKEADIQRYNEFLRFERLREERENRARDDGNVIKVEGLSGQRDQKQGSLEVERLRQIHALNKDDTFNQYLHEAEKFRKFYGKNIQCDICGGWEDGLYNHRGQTYCERHIPIPRTTEHEHKVTAWRHGSSRSYIKK